MKSPISDAGTNHDNNDHCDGSTFCSSSASTSDKSPPSLAEEEDIEDKLTPLHPAHHKLPQRASYHADDDDDEEDDEEMIQYNYNSGYTSSNFKNGCTVSLRRTLGANVMHRSAFSKHSNPITSVGRSMGVSRNRDVLRRTPGANVMHRSVAGTNNGKIDTASLPEKESINASSNINALPLDQDTVLENRNMTIPNDAISKLCKGDETNACTRILEYGLEIPSPILRKASDDNETTIEVKEHSKRIRTNEKSRAQGDKCSLSSAKTDIAHTPNPQSTRIAQSGSVKSRPPLNPNSSGRENYLYTPAEVSLANNRDLNLHPTAMSPNTIQLATSLDNLLDDGEVNLKSCEKKEAKAQTDLQKDSSFHRFTRTSCESSVNSICISSSSDATPVKDNSSSPRPANFSSGGFFSPPANQGPSQSNQIQPSFQPQHVHAPTPKKAGDTKSSSNYQYHHSSQNEGLEENNGYYVDGTKHPLVIHNHYHCSMHPFQTSHPALFDSAPGSVGYDANMYPYHSEFIRGATLIHGIPSPVPFQHQSHVSVSNTHIDYGHHQQHQLPHPSASPGIPSEMNPQAYPMHGLQFQSLSPVPFSPQHVVGEVAWSGHDASKFRGHNHWNAIGTSAGWEQPTHISSDYAYNGSIYPGAPIMSTQTTPHISPYPSWVPSEYGEYNGSCAASGSASMDEITYHNMMPNPNSSCALQQISGYDSEGPHHLVCAKENGEESYRDRHTKAVSNNEEYASSANEYVEGMTNESQYQKTPHYVQKVHVHDQSVKYQTLQRQDVSRIKSVKHGSNKHKKKQKQNRVYCSMDESNDRASISLRKKENLTITVHTTKKENSDSKRINKENLGEAINVDNKKAVHVRKVKKKAEIVKKRVVLGAKASELEKVELVESHTTRTIFQDFYRIFRAKQKVSLSSAAEFARGYLKTSTIPQSTHWRIYLELADLAKRGNNFMEARKLFCKVCNLQPHASQGWLEFSKLEEESGNLDICSQLLCFGLQFCECNDNLLTRAIKHEERMAHEHGNGDLSRARELLAPLKLYKIDKIWRAVLEGALMESRAGNYFVARRVLRYLMHWVPWYGPLYLEAFRLERDMDHPMKASSIVERGLRETPRYGPLWFGAFRLYEELDLEQNKYNLPQTMNMIERATISISKELIWKVYLEAAQAQERAAHHYVDKYKEACLDQKLDLCRQSFIKAIVACPEKLRWKVWLAAGRMELAAYKFKDARRLFLKSFSVVPAKGRAVVLLECSRLEEFVGNIELARAILCKSRIETGSDWKVFLCAVEMEARCGNRQEAIKLAQEGLKRHSGTGRLWAALVQLKDADGEEFQMDALKQSLAAAPKSGEVWCEAARMFMNPLSSTFDISTAVEYLQFSTIFTPQYGDSFLETLRLVFLQKMTKIVDSKLINEMKKTIHNIELQSQEDCHKLFVSSVGMSIQKAIENLPPLDVFFQNVDTSQLELCCSNADPNYGKLWFHCRRKQTDTARTVMRHAKEIIRKDLCKYAHVYMAAIMRRAAVDIMIRADKSQNDRSHRNYGKRADKQGEKQIRCLPSIPNVRQLISRNQLIDTDIGSQHVVNCLSSANFVTGIVMLNEKKDVKCLSLKERRSILFGNDLMLPSKLM